MNFHIPLLLNTELPTRLRHWSLLLYLSLNPVFLLVCEVRKWLFDKCVHLGTFHWHWCIKQGLISFWTNQRIRLRFALSQSQCVNHEFLKLLTYYERVCTRFLNFFFFQISIWYRIYLKIPHRDILQYLWCCCGHTDHQALPCASL